MTNRKKRSYTRELAELETFFEQEIALYQEILSHLSQEEYLLLIGETEMKEQIRAETKTLFKQVRKIQNGRKILLQSLLGLEYKNLFSFISDQEECCETLLILFEKCKALLSKIKDQKKRNKTLTEVIKTEGSIDPLCLELHPHMVYDGKSQKPLLITIDYPDEKQP